LPARVAHHGCPPAAVGQLGNPTAGRRLTRYWSQELILEVALLTVRPGQNADFEKAFREAQAIISAVDGYVSHRLQRCLERPDKYLLLVEWRRLEDHIIRFRQSAGYQEWKRLLHHFYDPFPTVEHYERVLEGSAHKDSR
jgi:heme-degrading monooxygenase HmoA